MPKQRTSSRGKPSKTLVHVVGIERDAIPAIVMNESEVGLAIGIPRKLDTLANLVIGTELSIDLRHICCCAVVRHVAPLTWGSLLGLEWRAHAIARQVGELISAAPGNNCEIAEVLSHALSNMWTCHEAGQWGRLAAQANQQCQQAKARDLPRLAELFNRFQANIRAVVATGDRKDLIATSIELELQDVIAKCVSAAVSNQQLAVLEQNH